MTSQQTRMAAQPPSGRLTWALLLLALYFAAQLAGWSRSLIGTEIWALYYAGRPFAEQLQSIRGDLVHPPLIYLLQRWWLSTFGHTDDSAKALALVVNIPTILLFTWLASRVTPAWRLASLLFCSTYLNVAGTVTQVRMYGLGLLWTVAAILLWDSWREKPSSLRLIGWGFVMIPLVYTHFFGLLILLALILANWLYGSRRWAFTAAAALVSAAYLLWAFYVLPEYLGRGLGPNLTWVNTVPTRALAEVPYGFLGSFPWVGGRKILALVALGLHVVLFGLAWQGMRRLWPPRREDATTRWFWTCTLLAGVPILLLYLFSVAIRPAFHSRFVLGVLPAYWLLIVLLGHRAGRAGRVMLYGVILPWAILSAGFSVETQRRPSQARLGTLFLAQELRPNELILFENGGLGNQVYWEWTRRLGRGPVRMEVIRPELDVGRLSVLPLADLNKLALKAVERVWFFFDGTQHMGAVVELFAGQGFQAQKAPSPVSEYLIAFVRSH